MAKELKQGEQQPSLFEKMNYQLMLAGLALIVIGFLLMMGGGRLRSQPLSPPKKYTASAASPWRLS